MTLLLNVVSSGYLSRILMLQIGAVPRLVALFLRLTTHGSIRGDIFNTTLELLHVLLILVRSSIIDSNSSGNVLSFDSKRLSPFVESLLRGSDEVRSIGILLTLSEHDICCLVNR